MHETLNSLFEKHIWFQNNYLNILLNFERSSRQRHMPLKFSFPEILAGRIYLQSLLPIFAPTKRPLRRSKANI